MNRYLHTILEVIAWSLMLIGFILLLLMVLGVLHSPELEIISVFISAGLFIQIGELRSRTSNLDELKNEFAEMRPKFDMLWSDFKKRKEL